MIIVAPLNPTQELPTFCGLCGTRYDGDECPTCRAEREEAKRMIEDRLRRDREQKDENDRLVRNVEEWLEEQSQGSSGRKQE